MIGRFYFTRTENGNLIGEFSNNRSESIQTESAETTAQTVNYIGTYRSTWNDGTAIEAELTIEIKPNTNNQIFTLIWRIGNDIAFWGEGMLCRQILIGDYRDFEEVPA